MSSALVTDAPTLALARVLEQMKSVRLDHRMSILRLCIDVFQHIWWTFFKKSFEQDQELFADDGEKFTRISDRFRQIIQEQGNLEAFEIPELSNKVPCQHYRKCMSSGCVYCSCGR